MYEYSSRGEPDKEGGAFCVMLLVPSRGSITHSLHSMVLLSVFFFNTDAMLYVPLSAGTILHGEAGDRDPPFL